MRAQTFQNGMGLVRGPPEGAGLAAFRVEQFQCALKQFRGSGDAPHSSDRFSLRS